MNIKNISSTPQTKTNFLFSRNMTTIIRKKTVNEIYIDFFRPLIFPRRQSHKYMPGLDENVFHLDESTCTTDWKNSHSQPSWQWSAIELERAVQRRARKPRYPEGVCLGCGDIFMCCHIDKPHPAMYCKEHFLEVCLTLQ